MSKRKTKPKAQKKTVRPRKERKSFLETYLPTFFSLAHPVRLRKPTPQEQPLKTELHVVRETLKKARIVTSKKAELIGIEELFRQTAQRHDRKTAKALPSAKLLDKPLKNTRRAIVPVQALSDDFSDLLEVAAPEEEAGAPTILSYHEEKKEDVPVTPTEFGTVVTPERPAPKGIRKIFFLHLPLSLGSGKATRGKITSASAPKQRQEMPLDSSVDEVRQFKELPKKEEAPIVAQSKTGKKKKEVTIEKEFMTSAKKKKETVGEKEARQEDEKSRVAELKEMERIRKNRRSALRAQKTTGLQQFLASVAHFGLGKERNLFTQNLATMLNAGLPLIDAIRILKIETRTRAMKKLIQRILDSVENGSALWRAMDEQRFFSPHAISLIHIGEEAGNLAENMEYLSIQQEKDHALKQKVKMAMIYPAIVLTLMFIIVMGLGMFVLPNLIQVLYSLNVPLPLVTRIVIAFTNFFTTYGKTAVPGTLVGLILLIIIAKFTPLRVITQWVVFHIPGIGTLARQATIARFGVILGGLLKAGVPMVEARRTPGRDKL